MAQWDRQSKVFWGSIKHDIFGLFETWHTNENCIKKLKPNIPPEYLYFHNARKKNIKRRNSGGIIVP